MLSKVLRITKSALEKHARFDAFEAVREEFKEAYAAAHTELSEDEMAEKNTLIDTYYHDVEKDAMRRCILDEGVRLDGRKTTDIRPIWCEVNPLPGPHGSAIFTRGETQSLTTTTLGTKLDEKMVDDVLDKSYMRFLLHYNFPPSPPAKPEHNVGVGRSRDRSRPLGMARSEGTNPRRLPLHRACGERYPRIQRFVVDGYRCAGTLSLMDAGVPVKAPRIGYCHGSHQEPRRRQVRRALRHPR